VLGYTYRECKEKEINLGLDLKGGMAVTLEVSIPELVENLSENSEDPAFKTAMASARERQKSSDADFITLFGEEYAKVPGHGPLSAIFYSPERKGHVRPRRQRMRISDRPASRSRDRVEQHGEDHAHPYRQVRCGAAKYPEAAVHRRIQIELPGVKDKEPGAQGAAEHSQPRVLGDL
jgi:SecD/SecF fusion protein